MANLAYFDPEIHDDRFELFIIEHPEERHNRCDVCEGIGWLECEDCEGECMELGKDHKSTGKVCEFCNGYGALHCGQCANTGLAVWFWWFNREAIDLIKWSYWHCSLAGVNNSPPIPKQVYWQQKSPVSSMAVVAADNQVELGHSSETGS